MPDSAPIFILNNPQIGENIGMAMRAMLNFQYSHLRLINPRPHWSQQKATDTAAGAAQIIMPTMKTYDSIESATADIHYMVATTARPRHLNIPQISARQAAENIHKKLRQKKTCAILFGNEQSGLGNDDITHAHAITHFPTNANFPSLNLAQAVMLMAYELSHFQPVAAACSHKTDDMASLGEIDFFCRQLDAELHARGFYRSAEMRPHMRRNIRVMFQRMAPTEQDIRTWHGIVKCLKG